MILAQPSPSTPHSQTHPFCLPSVAVPKLVTYPPGEDTSAATNCPCPQAPGCFQSCKPQRGADVSLQAHFLRISKHVKVRRDCKAICCCSVAVSKHGEPSPRAQERLCPPREGCAPCTEVLRHRALRLSQRSRSPGEILLLTIHSTTTERNVPVGCANGPA